MVIERVLKFCLGILLLSVFANCTNSKQLAYFQDLNDTSKVQIVHQRPFEPLKLQVDDQVEIIISSTQPEASQYFNLSAAGTSPSSAGNISAPSSAGNFSIYTVSPRGFITMPVLGDLKVIGLTTQELKDQLTNSLQPYVKGAIVNVRLVNFKVTVIGEIGRPVTVAVSGEKYSVLEAIGAAGDMTEFGHRYNVKVLHKTDSVTEVAHLNFNTSDVLKSPYYQLRQNDIVYVEPDKVKGFRSERFVVILPIITSITAFVISLSLLWIRFQ